MRFTPIFGTYSEQSAHAYLLSIDGFNILLDCGWTDSFDANLVEPLRPYMPNIHAVLLSHPDLPHLGALPYAFSKLGLPPKTPVFATLPVWRMGQMFLNDAYHSKQQQAQFDLFSSNDIEVVFDMLSDSSRFHLLKYQQCCSLEQLPAFCENLQTRDLSITPHPAGHMLGGSVWNIQKNAENILYAVHLNHRRERHLNPTTLPSFPRPSHLFIGAANSQSQTQSLKTSDMLDPILATIRKNGNVLIPTDTAGRIVELAIELTAAWEENRPSLSLPGNSRPVPLVVFHQFASKTFSFARTMIEWMSDAVVKRFDTTRHNPFDLDNLHICTSRSQLDALPSPKVVLSSFESLNAGFARDLFIDWAPDPRNLVIFVCKPQRGTLSYKLFGHVQHSKGLNLQDTKVCNPVTLSLQVSRREPLSGEELRQWREEQHKVSMEGENLDINCPENSNSIPHAEEPSLADVDSQRGFLHSTPASQTDSGNLSHREQEHAFAVAVSAEHGQENDRIHSSTNAGVVQQSLDSQQNVHDFNSNDVVEDDGKDSEEDDDDDDDDDDDNDDDIYDEDLILKMSGAPGATRVGHVPLLGARSQKSAVLGTAPLGIPSLARVTSSDSFTTRSDATLRTSQPSRKFEEPSSFDGKRDIGRHLTVETRNDDSEMQDNAKSSDDSKHWDDYGQSISINRFAIGEDHYAAMNVRDNSVNRGHEAHEPELLSTGSDESGHEEDIPYAYVMRELSLTIACSMIYVDRSGLSEGDALKHVIKEVEPHKVILINGTRNEIEHLRVHLSQALSGIFSGSDMAKPENKTSRVSTRYEQALASLQHSAEKTEAILPSSQVKGEPQAVPDPEFPQDAAASRRSSVVLCPADGETIDVTSVTSTQYLTLEETLLQNLHWNDVGNSSVAYLKGALDSVTNDASQLRLKTARRSAVSTAENASNNGNPQAMEVDSAVLDVRQEAPVGSPHGDNTFASNRDTAGGDRGDAMDTRIIDLCTDDDVHYADSSLSTVFIGSVKLSNLKDAVVKAGISAELAEGVLCVENAETGAVVLVKKLGPQHIVLEGALCEEYYKVRDILYDRLVLVSGY